MPQDAGDWVEIARTGVWTDMSGATVRIGPEELQAMAGTPLADAADGVPLVFGHPKVGDPAYGWATALRVQGDRLLARFRAVPEAVAAAVRAGHYRHVSPAVTPQWRLVHVGLLGAAAPGIKGLQPLDGVRLAAPDTQALLRLAGPETYPQQEEDIVDKDVAALKQEIEELTKRLAELQEALAAKEAELTDSAKTLDEEKAAFAAYKTEQVRLKREARLGALVKDGKLLPGDLPRVRAYAEALAAGGRTLSFAASDGSTQQVPADEDFLAQLERGSGHGLFREFAGPAGSGGSGGAGGGEAPRLDTTDINRHV